jgi:hypothetical protein
MSPYKEEKLTGLPGQRRLYGKFHRLDRSVELLIKKARHGKKVSLGMERAEL